MWALARQFKNLLCFLSRKECIETKTREFPEALNQSDEVAISLQTVHESTIKVNLVDLAQVKRKNKSYVILNIFKRDG